MGALETVQSIYEAFGRGDAPAVLACLSEDVEWEYGAGGSTVPWLQPRRGHDGALAFFDSLQHMGLQVFRPKRILAEGNTVVGLIDIEFEVPRTGRRVEEEDEVHIWHFDAAGKVIRFRHRVDTLEHERAWNP